jgi:hypothetical protein
LARPDPVWLSIVKIPSPVSDATVTSVAHQESPSIGGLVQFGQPSSSTAQAARRSWRR